ncbi:receptor-like protein 7 [Camellia sinensis]|uniref:receptor-like protein 7 n=1 Tax=Camellia sinensis TaxID=4442 RepID=UPI0010366FF0|nr:receptor-like protein 7 [Camellia sinensis]
MSSIAAANRQAAKVDDPPLLNDQLAMCKASQLFPSHCINRGRESRGKCGGLKLEKPGLRSLLQNLTNLKVLRLNDVSISSEVPDTLANLTSLTTLVFENCGLRGEFPISIFYLPNLQVLDVSLNGYLTGHLPEFHPSSPLQHLMLSYNSFSGKLPNSIGNLNFLNQLNFSGYYFSGSLPASLGNLTQLNYVSLSSNKFNVGTLQILGKLTELTDLELRDLNLYVSIPSVLSNLTQLTYLDLSSNLLSGEITSHITNLTHLISLDVSINQLRSPTQRSLSELKNLETLDLSFNNLSGFELEIFLMLKNLIFLDLSGNNLTVLTKKTSNNTLNKLKVLELNSSNSRKFTNFLHFQDKLDILSLAENKIHGEIMAWMWNTSVETLAWLSLRNNFLTGFEQQPDILPWDNLGELDLSYNRLQGPLPIPPLSTCSCSVSYNGLTGELPPLICRLSSLYVLDLSNNNLTGTILPCLSNFSDSLTVLNLQGNNFQGPIPHSYNRGNKLKMIDLSDNKLQGKVPGSLANCTELEFLDLSNNLIDDAFPLWLGDLTKLQVLILRSNKFYGAIENPKIKLELPNLHIIDLSHNGFTGDLPSKYFQNWNAMKFFDVNKMKYMNTIIEVRRNNDSWGDGYWYTTNITNKCVNTEYQEIPNIFTAIDLSSNKFEGVIPEFIGNLKGLKQLNLSNNNLNGGIPSCLGNLTNLESLDLSQNKLSGEIPQQLALLTFLEFLNVSNNHLTGPIPHGQQFNTFENNSYEGNSGLCGDPLSRKCGKLEAPPPLNSEQDNDSAFPSKFDWIFICMGYVSGIVVGMVIGHTITTSQNAMQTRAPPCCNSNKAFQLANPLLVILLLIRRLHHGSNSFLHGSINSSSSLFSLVHLQRLNLAYNDFDYSCIPSEIGHLSGLTSLNFSSSVFSCQIPLKISKLSKLVSIDLSFNVDSSNAGGLKLEKPGLRSLLQNLTNLKVLRLNDVSISSEVPDTLANLTSLTTLVFENCGLRGEFPISIFYLPNLQVLDVSLNGYLTGHLPEFHPSSPLQHLMLSYNSFSGKLPNSIGNLNFLNQLNFSGYYFSGSLPTSLGNLTQLNYASLSSNKFNVGTLQILGKLTELTDLELRDLNLYGSIPSVLSNLTQLTYLDLSSNLLSGEITSHITNLTHLISLDVSINQLRSPTQRSLSELKNLETLALSFNNLSGFELEIFLMLKNLIFLDLSVILLKVLNLKGYTNFQVPIPHSYNRGNKLKMIDFSDNKLQGKVPRSLASCTELEILDLSNNLIDNTFPLWLGDLTKLQVLILRSNKFYGAIGNPKIKLELPNLHIIGLSHNGFTGDLPSKYFQNWNAVKFFDVDKMKYMDIIIEVSTNNDIWGDGYWYTMNITNKGVNTEYQEILNIFTVIDLSSNKFEGLIPEFIGNLKGLKLLNLSNNNLNGGIPSCFGNLTNLESLDLSQNKL